MARLSFRETEKQRGAKSGNRKIRCPKCAWEPQRHHRWSCVCGHEWNTFDTRGVCPGCDATWAETQCLECWAWSPHDEWYVDASG